MRRILCCASGLLPRQKALLVCKCLHTAVMRALGPHPPRGHGRQLLPADVYVGRQAVGLQQVDPAAGRAHVRGLRLRGPWHRMPAQLQEVLQPAVLRACCAQSEEHAGLWACGGCVRRTGVSRAPGCT